MHGLIIVNQRLGHNAYKVKRFKEEFIKLGVSLDVFVNDGSRAVIRDGKVFIKLPKADFVIYLDKDLYFAKQLEKAGYRLFNKPDFMRLCDDKNLTNITLANHGIRLPKTISAPLFMDERLKKEHLTFLDSVIYELKLPVVIKRTFGSQGKGVMLANTKKELISYYRKYCREPLQFQEFIPSSAGKSLRVLIIGQKVVGGFLRFNKGDFRSNYGEAATSKKARNCDNHFEFAQKIADLLKIEYAGIDIIFGYYGESFLCEINSNAFFEEFERVTRINVAKKYAQMVIRKIKKKDE